MFLKSLFSRENYQLSRRFLPVKANLISKIEENLVSKTTILKVSNTKFGLVKENLKNFILPLHAAGIAGCPVNHLKINK
jgi:hypothetical protein